MQEITLGYVDELQSVSLEEDFVGGEYLLKQCSECQSNLKIMVKVYDLILYYCPTHWKSIIFYSIPNFYDKECKCSQTPPTQVFKQQSFEIDWEAEEDTFQESIPTVTNSLQCNCQKQYPIVKNAYPLYYETTYVSPKKPKPTSQPTTSTTDTENADQPDTQWNEEYEKSDLSTFIKYTTTVSSSPTQIIRFSPKPLFYTHKHIPYCCDVECRFLFQVMSFWVDLVKEGEFGSVFVWECGECLKYVADVQCD